LWSAHRDAGVACAHGHGLVCGPPRSCQDRAIEDEIAQRDRTRQQAEDFLNRPENRTTRDQSQFLNELIERKSFSWTRVLEDLEKVMPARVHLVSIHPELDEDNQLTLKMLVAGDSRDRRRLIWRGAWKTRGFSPKPISKASSTERQALEIPCNSTSSRIYVPETVPVPAAKTEISKRTRPDARLTANPEKDQDRPGGLVGVDVVAVIVLLSPLVGSARSRGGRNSTRLWGELQIKTHQVEPLTNLPEKVKTANRRSRTSTRSDFRPGFADRYSIWQAGGSNGVTIDTAKYKVKDSEIGSLQPVEMKRTSRAVMFPWRGSSMRWSAMTCFSSSTASRWPASRMAD
jgi:hypothetical protein